MAGCRAELGILEVLGGRLGQARTLLDQALDLSLAARGPCCGSSRDRSR